MDATISWGTIGSGTGDPRVPVVEHPGRVLLPRPDVQLEERRDAVAVVRTRTRSSVASSAKCRSSTTSTGEALVVTVLAQHRQQRGEAGLAWHPLGAGDSDRAAPLVGDVLEWSEADGVKAPSQDVHASRASVDRPRRPRRDWTCRCPPRRTPGRGDRRRAARRRHSRGAPRAAAAARAGACRPVSCRRASSARPFARYGRCRRRTGTHRPGRTPGSAGGSHSLRPRRAPPPGPPRRGTAQVASASAAEMRSRNSGWVDEAIAHRVWGTTRIRSHVEEVDSEDQRLERPSVTRPPGLRKILASPGFRPTIRSGSMRESMHVTMAMPACAMPSKPPWAKWSANSALASTRSSKSPSGARTAPSVMATRAQAQPGPWTPTLSGSRDSTTSSCACGTSRGHETSTNECWAWSRARSAPASGRCTSARTRSASRTRPRRPASPEPTVPGKRQLLRPQPSARCQQYEKFAASPARIARQERLRHGAEDPPARYDDPAVVESPVAPNRRAEHEHRTQRFRDLDESRELGLDTRRATRPAAAGRRSHRRTSRAPETASGPRCAPRRRASSPASRPRWRRDRRPRCAACMPRRGRSPAGAARRIRGSSCDAGRSNARPARF